MAKVTAPLFGLEAKGTIADAITFASWKGVGYARQRVVPTNPRSVAQTSVRNVFAWINDLWRYLPASVTAVWDAVAKGRPETARNALLRYNVPALSEAEDLDDLILSPGTGNAPPLDGLTASTGSQTGSINVTATAPVLPDSWTMEGVIWVAIKQQDPHNEFDPSVGVATDDSSPYSATITGLEAGEQYLVTAIGKYTNARGTTVYGPAINTSATAKA